MTFNWVQIDEHVCECSIGDSNLLVVEWGKYWVSRNGVDCFTPFSSLGSAKLYLEHWHKDETEELNQ